MVAQRADLTVDWLDVQLADRWAVQSAGLTVDRRADLTVDLSAVPWADLWAGLRVYR